LTREKRELLKNESKNIEFTIEYSELNDLFELKMDEPSN